MRTRGLTAVLGVVAAVFAGLPAAASGKPTATHDGGCPHSGPAQRSSRAVRRSVRSPPTRSSGRHTLTAQVGAVTLTWSVDGGRGTTCRLGTAGTRSSTARSMPPATSGRRDGFAVTLLPSAPTFTTTVTGVRNGPLAVRSGVTCLVGATINGPVMVDAGVSMVATDTHVAGPIRADGAAGLQLLRSTVAGPVSVDGVTRSAVLVGPSVQGPVSVTRSRTTEAAVLAGTVVSGPLSCSGNASAPVNLQAPNQVSGPRAGQCARFEFR